MIVGGPLIDELIRDPHAEMRDAIILVEIPNVNCIPAGRAVISEARGAASRSTCNRLSSGSGFPWRDWLYFGSLQLHGLGFDTSRILADATLCVACTRLT